MHILNELKPSLYIMNGLYTWEFFFRFDVILNKILYLVIP